jgi:hypothetical protein
MLRKCAKTGCLSVDNQQITPNQEMVTNSSYFVFDDSPIITSPSQWLPSSCFINNGVNTVTKHVGFYSYNGDKLWTIPANLFRFTQIDQNAPKPQPRSFRRIWKKFQISPNSKFDGQGHTVVFHDKSGNRIGWEWTRSKYDHPSNWINWDMSQAVEEVSDYSDYK